MGTRTVRLREDLTVDVDEETYERIEAERREGESLSEAYDRLAGEASLLDLVGTITDEEAEEMKAAIEASRRAGIESTEKALRKWDEAFE
jgi:predicted CopG family antitoxin